MTIDTRPDNGKVFMVVRADNIDLGQKACKAMGELTGGTGKIIEIIGGPNAVAPVHPKTMPVILTTTQEVDLWLSAGMREAIELHRPLLRRT